MCVFLLATKFMSALSKDGAIDEEMLSADQLDLIYTPLRENVSANIHRQEKTLEQIQVCVCVHFNLCMVVSLVPA